MTRRRLALMLGLLAVAAVVAAGAWYRYGMRADGPLVLYGNVDIREVALAFRQSGRLQTLAVDEGDAVQAEQLVATLDDQPYREALAEATATVAADRATLNKLERGNRPQDIAQAEAAVERTTATYHNAERDYARQRRLRASDAGSQQALEAARTARDEAAAELESARQALSLQREGARSEDIDAARNQLQASLARADQAQTALDDTRLYAPADATVLARVREPGSMVDASAPVLTLSLRDPVYVRAYIAEPRLGRIAPGMAVEVRTDSSDTVYHGRIGFIASQAEFTPKSVQTTELRTDLVYRLRIVIHDADEGLRQGMPVTVTVPDAAA